MKTFNLILRKSRYAILIGIVSVMSILIFSKAIKASSEASLNTDFQLWVDMDSCNGCGNCEVVAPDCFVLYEEKAWVLVGWEYHPDQYLDALDQCPYTAIHIRPL